MVTEVSERQSAGAPQNWATTSGDRLQQFKSSQEVANTVTPFDLLQQNDNKAQRNNHKAVSLYALWHMSKFVMAMLTLRT
jgi:ribosomal protein S12 methylthiotransferase accessory factor YcaO